MSGYRIALVVDHFLPRVGGIELQVADLARQLAAAGHRPEVITATPGDGSLCSGTADPGPCAIPIHRLRGSRLPGFEVAAGPTPFRELRSVLSRDQFDVVHCHTSVVSPLAYSAARVCRKLNIPSVLTAHSLLGVYQPLFRALHPMLPWTTWPTRLTAVSGVAADVLRRLSGGRDVDVLANGIDLVEWSTERAERNAASEVRVVSVMRLNIKKRAHALLDAAAEVVQGLPRSRTARFTLIGDGPCRNRLLRHSRRLGIADQVEFLGTQPRTVIRDVLGRSDIFALPTRNEAFGIAVLEARCAGLPIVAMAGCGVADLVENGNQGFLAASDTDFAACLARLIVDDDLRRAMAARSREGVETFAWQQVVERHLDVYTEAIAQCRSAALTSKIRVPKTASSALPH